MLLSAIRENRCGWRRAQASEIADLSALELRGYVVLRWLPEQETFFADESDPHQPLPGSLTVEPTGLYWKPTPEGCGWLEQVQALASERRAAADAEAAVDAIRGAADPSAGASDSLEEAASYAALLRVYTSGLSDDRIAAAAQVVANKRLSVNNKLYKLDKLLPIPPTASAAVLAELFDISKQAVIKTAWWAEHRSGEGAAKVEQRRAIHHDRAAQLERPDEDE
jgi:hypothetical protein